MATEFKYGKTEQNMKVTGDLIKLAVMENSGMLMVMCSKENGLMKESGKTIYNMAKVKRFGPITQCMKDITMKARNMEKDSIFGKTAQAMMEIGMKTE
jgi:hypothetical protein